MKKIVNILGKVILVLSVIFVIYAVWKLGFDFSGITNMPAFILVSVIGIILKTATVYSSGYVWYDWLSFFAGKRADLGEATRVYTKANIGKYLPGNVMQYVGRNLYGQKIGITQKKIAASSIIEIISQVLVAFITALLLSTSQLQDALIYVDGLFGGKMLMILVIGGALGIALVIVCIVLLRKKITDILKGYSLRDFLVSLIRCMVIHAINLILLGVVFVLLYYYMGGRPDLQTMLGIIGGYIISWVIGFVTPGSPGGIGVREAVLTLLVGPLVGSSLILSIALIHRLITIVGDFAAYVLALLLIKDKDVDNQ